MTSATLVGRDEELRLIAAFLDQVADGGTLLFTGEPGVGKTTLLDAVEEAAQAAGIGVLRAAGSEFWTRVSFSGLAQLLRPLSGCLPSLSPLHRGALLAIDGDAGPAQDRLVVFQAALALLGEAGGRRPLLMIVDDLQWLDRWSASALGFVARRLAGQRAGLLAVSRPGAASFSEQAGLAEHELRPLDPASAASLLSTRFPELSPQVRQRLLAEAHGNPLALLELPAMLSGPQRAALAPLPSVLPLSQRLQSLFAVSRFAAELPAEMRLLDQAYADPARTAAAVLPELDAAIASLRDETDHLRILMISSTAHFTDRQPGCREALRRVMREVRQSSAVTPLITALEHLSLDSWMSGQWDQAQELAAALAAPRDQARGLFETALATPRADQWPFDLARVRLLYGEWLRRERSAAEARAQLSPAMNTFRQLGALPWQARAGNELRAAGLATLAADTASPLSPLDRQIAELAAAGLTNKQIGERLYLSHRTVAAHLYQIFPRLGITSRAALRDALDALDGASPDPIEEITNDRE